MLERQVVVIARCSRNASRFRGWVVARWCRHVCVPSLSVAEDRCLGPTAGRLALLTRLLVNVLADHVVVAELTVRRVLEPQVQILLAVEFVDVLLVDLVEADASAHGSREKVFAHKSVIDDVQR